MDYPQNQIIPEGYKGSNKEEKVEQMFNKIAPTYDRLNHSLSFGIDRYWRKRAINYLRPFKPQTMLDIATGTGDFALLAYNNLHPQQLIGIDISDGMMDVARKKAEAAKLADKISFKHENCDNLHFEDNTFDTITSAFGVRNFASLDTCFKEMYRVMKDGGHLVILELSTPTSFPMKQLYAIYSRLIIPSAGKLISSEKNAYDYLPHSIKACIQGEEMCQSIRDAGFKDVRYKALTMGICTLYTAIKNR